MFNSEEPQRKMVERDYQHDKEVTAMNMAADDSVYLAQKEQTTDLTRWQQDLKEDLERSIHYLNREIYNDEESKWVKETEEVGTEEDGTVLIAELKPIMNKRGIAMFRSAIEPCISRNLMMSNYKESQIFVKLRSIVFTFIQHTAYHFEEYDLEKGNLSIVVRMFKDIVEPAHWRSMNAGERISQNTIRKQVEAINHNGMGGGGMGKQPKSFLQGMLGG